MNRTFALITGMYDPTPGNFWFGKKWYYVKTEDVFKCPDDLTASGDNVFVNNQGKKEPKLKIECL